MFVDLLCWIINVSETKGNLVSKVDINPQINNIDQLIALWDAT